MSTPGDLLVILYDTVVGTLSPKDSDSASFTYDREYLPRRRRPSLSVRLPARPDTYRAPRVQPFLAGLLPESAEVRRRMGDSVARSSGAVDLLAAMGWDCPGAVQITPPEHLAAMRARTSGLRPVDDRWIGRRLADLDDPAAVWALPEEHWSLPGQQAKLALARTDSGWAEATGSAPTTHILKPGISTLALQALTEHATMRAAAALGVDVAETVYTEFDGRPAIVVIRFDRFTLGDGRVLRLHQEDMGQALGRMPDRKYEEHGGPGLADMATVLRAHSREPRRQAERLADFLLINTPQQHLTDTPRTFPSASCPTATWSSRRSMTWPPACLTTGRRRPEGRPVDRRRAVRRPDPRESVDAIGPPARHRGGLRERARFSSAASRTPSGKPWSMWGHRPRGRWAHTVGNLADYQPLLLRSVQDRPLISPERRTASTPPSQATTAYDTRWPTRVTRSRTQAASHQVSIASALG